MEHSSTEVSLQMQLYKINVFQAITSLHQSFLRFCVGPSFKLTHYKINRKSIDRYISNNIVETRKIII